MLDDLIFYKPNTFFVSKLLYEHPLMTTNEMIQFDYQYKIYEVFTGQGNSPIFLVCEPFTNLPLGHNDLILKHEKEPFKKLEKPNFKMKKFLIERFFGKPKKGEEKTFKELLDLNYNIPIFAVNGECIEKEKLDEYLKSLPPNEIQFIIDDFFKNDGWKIDDKLKYLYKTDKIILTEGKLNPSEVMIYQPHKIIVTNTKVGKTSVARMCGYVLDKATSSRFLGFATSDSVAQGLGNGLIRTTYFDEVSSLNQIFIDHILNYLEFGETEVALGKSNVKTRGWSQLVFHSNPEVPSDDPNQLLIGLNSFFQKFTMRADALGSRIACIIFSNNFERAKRIAKITNEERLKTKILFESIIKNIIQKIEELLTKQKIVEWLDMDIKNYKDEVFLLLEKNPQIPDLMIQIYKSHADGAFRHIRGFAFKQAILDNIYDLYFCEDMKNFDYEKFLASCEEHLKKICDMNIESLKNMCETSVEIKDLAFIFLKNLPEYLRGLTIIFSMFLKEKEKDLVVLMELKELWEKNAEKIGIKNYIFFSQLLEQIERVNLIRINLKLKIFGYEIYKQDEVLFLRILPENKNYLLAISKHNEEDII